MMLRSDVAKINREAMFQRTFISSFNLMKLANIMYSQWPEIFAKLYGFTSTLFTNMDSGGKLIMYGNGGSAADCDHIVGEFRGRFILNRPSVEAISLSDSMATVTAIANDFGYEKVFSHQLDGITKSCDSIIALTTSGTSKNIVSSLYNVKHRYPSINSLIITGQMGVFSDFFKYHIQIPITCQKNTVARIQEMTMFLLHTMCFIFDGLYEDHMYGPREAVD